jgi:hypothetical protein
MKLGMTPWDIARVTTLANGLADPHLVLSGTYKIDADGFRWDVARGSSGYSDYQVDRRLDGCFRDNTYTYANAVNYAGQLGNYDTTLNNSPWIKIPSKFTGTMRKVVQMLVGEGHPILYEFSINRSHGIWHASDGTPWVIEIGTRGVLAARLPLGISDSTTLANFKTTQAIGAYDLAYVPGAGNPIPEDPQALAAELSAGRVLRLAAASVLDGFYALSPYFEACGWAFSYSGHEAQNTAYGWYPSSDPSEQWLEGYRFKIVFSESAGAPQLASFAEVERGFLHGDRITHFKFPGASSAIGTRSFDIYHGNLSQPPGGSDTTFYVYYDGESEKLCKYASAGSSSVITHGDSFSPGVPTVHVDPMGMLRNGSETVQEAAQVYVSGARISALNKGFSGNLKINTTSAAGGACMLQPADNVWFIFPEYGQVSGKYISDADVSEEHLFTGTVPFHDREAIYIYHYYGLTYNAGAVIYEEQKYYGSSGGTKQAVIPFIPNGGFYSESDPQDPGSSGQGFGTLSSFSKYPLGNSSGLDSEHRDYGFPGGTVGFNLSWSGSVPSSDNTRTATAVLNASGGVSQTVHTVSSSSNILEDWLKYATSSPDGPTETDYLYYHVIADGFSSARLASNISGGISDAGYSIIDVDTNYQPAYETGNFERFFFGVP